MRQTIIAAIIALIAVIFAIQNSDEQVLRIFFWDISMPLSLLILLTLIIGVVAGMLVMTNKFLRQRNLANDLKKQLQDLKNVSK